MANENADNFQVLEEEEQPRANPRLICGIIISVVVAVILAISMPSSLDGGEPSIPSEEPIVTSTLYDIPHQKQAANHSNTTQSNITLSPTPVKEVPVEKNILDEIVINQFEDIDEDVDDKYRVPKEDNSEITIEKMISAFMATEEFEDIIKELEMIDEVEKIQKTRRENGFDLQMPVSEADRPSPKTTFYDKLVNRYKELMEGKDPEEIKELNRIGEAKLQRAKQAVYEKDRRRREASYTTVHDDMDGVQFHYDYGDFYGDPNIMRDREKDDRNKNKKYQHPHPPVEV